MRACAHCERIVINVFAKCTVNITNTCTLLHANINKTRLRPTGVSGTDPQALRLIRVIFVHFLSSIAVLIVFCAVPIRFN